ncbi:hypothetical protein PIB30_057323 [Stylosanthes scabra]|uniref:Uncharacterized protein n=1 Tax=Stylosanthes scabra TaxID=79078 RepID=A0ABU6RK06_9FABA|nr:hypothetical protein [Stylosanthes scabra]
MDLDKFSVLPEKEEQETLEQVTKQHCIGASSSSSEEDRARSPDEEKVVDDKATSDEEEEDDDDETEEYDSNECVYLPPRRFMTNEKYLVYLRQVNESQVRLASESQQISECTFKGFGTSRVIGGAKAIGRFWADIREIHYGFGPSGPNVRNSSPRALKVGRSELPSLTISQIVFLTLFVLRRSDMLIARRLLVATLALEKLLGGVSSVLTADACTYLDRGERELRCPLVFRNNDGG